MPITDVPPTQPPETEERSPNRARSRAAARYGLDEYSDGYDLMHVLEDLEDERARVVMREKIWIALILHLVLLLLFLFLPRFLPHYQVRTALKNSPKDKMTFLTLPPDALKQIKPKVAPPSDQDRRQETPHPVPQNHTLDQMRRSGPPAPVQAPPKPAPQPQPQPAQQQPQPTPPKPQPTPPTPKSQSSPVEAPKPRPNFAQPSQTPSESLAQAERQAERGGAVSGGGDMGQNMPQGGNQGTAQILSDTLGVDFGPYIRRVVYDTKQAWYPIIPEVAQPPINKQGISVVRFKIAPDGSVVPHSMKLEGPAGDQSLDEAAWGAITSASPFPPLPKNFKGPFLELRFFFLYNKTPDAR